VRTLLTATQAVVCRAGQCNSDGMIHVLDELRVLPGHLADVRRLVHETYEPALIPLGMTREHTWIAPAVELLDEPTELLLLWSVEDTPAFWRARLGAMADARVADFWGAVTPMLESRNRRIMIDPDERTAALQ
jgi:hypothetical protein